MSAVMAQSATIESENAQALKDLDELAAAKAARETELTAERAEAQQALAASKANETKYEGRIQELSDEIKRLPATARLAADAQAAVYTLMKDEADDIAAGISRAAPSRMTPADVVVPKVLATMDAKAATTRSSVR